MGSAILSGLRLGCQSRWGVVPDATGNEHRVVRETNSNFRPGGPATAIHNKENTVNLRMLRSAVLAAAFLAGSASLFAQAPAAGSPASGKVGVLNVQGAIANTAEGKVASAELQSQFAPRQNELQNLQKQIEDIRQRLQAGGDKLSQEEQARLQRQGEVLTKQAQRKQEDYNDDVQAALGEVRERIGRKLVDILDRYARENGYVAIFDSSAQASPIIYASNQIDVTQEIVKLYDQAYPVKASAAPAKPATAPSAKPVAAPVQKPAGAQKPQ